MTIHAPEKSEMDIDVGDLHVLRFSLAPQKWWKLVAVAFAGLQQKARFAEMPDNFRQELLPAGLRLQRQSLELGQVG